jgi:hypothetical protein
MTGADQLMSLFQVREDRSLQGQWEKSFFAGTPAPQR